MGPFDICIIDKLWFIFIVLLDNNDFPKGDGNVYEFN